MTNFELDKWKLVRAEGRGLFVTEVLFKRCLWLALPALATLGLALIWRGGDHQFWLNLRSLVWTYAGLAALIGLAEGLYEWSICEREYQLKGGLWRQRGIAPLNAPNLGASYRLAPLADSGSPAESFSEQALINEAQNLQNAHVQGLINLDERCERFDPLLRASMAKEVHFLANRAGVCEQAALVALINQFEN